MSVSRNSLFDQRLLHALLEYEAEWAEGKAPPAREFAARHAGLAPGLLRELVVLEFRWLWQTGREDIAEVQLNRYPEYRDDDEVVLALVRIELAFQPNRPDPDKLARRFPRLRDDVLLLLEANREAERDESAPPPGLLSHSARDSLPATLATQLLEAPAPDGAPLAAGATLSVEDRYRVVRLIDQGGQKYVYEAQQLNPGRVVALKTPRGAAAGKVMVLEGQLTAQLDHQKIPQVMNLSGPGADRPVLAEKHIAGEPWSEVLRRQRAEVSQAPPEGRQRLRRQFLRENLGYLQDVCDALAYAHSRGVIHRDLKPANVMLSRFNDTLRRYTEVYLVDWGLALYVGDDDGAAVKAPRRAGVRGFSGTPCYAAPEMWAGVGERLSTATDVFLLGAVLYELLTDTPPYATENLVRLQMLGRLARIPPPEERAPDRPVPLELSQLARKATAADPQDRYPDAAAFAQALDAWQRHAAAEEQCQQALARREQVLAGLRAAADRRQARHAFLSALIEVADQFRQAARAWEAPGLPPPVDNLAYRRALEGERGARLDLASLAEQTEDFSLAEAQLERVGALPPPFDAGLDQRRQALRRKALRRQRTRLLLRGAAASVALLTAGLVGLGFVVLQKHHAVLLEAAARGRAEEGRAVAEQLRQAESDAKARAEDLAEDRRRMHRAQEWLTRATLAREEQYQAGAALYYARALAEREDPAVRLQWREALQRSLAPREHGSQLVQTGSLVYSQDGRYLLSGDALGRGDIRVWDLADGRQVRVLPGHPTPPEVDVGFAVRKLVRHPSDPSLVFSAGLDGTVRCTDFRTGRPIRQSPQEVDGRRAQLLSLDVAAAEGAAGGLRVATGDSLGRLVFRDPETLRPTTVVADAHPGGVSALAFQPRGGLCVTGGRDGRVRAWDGRGRPVREFAVTKPSGGPAAVNDVAVSPDGKLVAAAAEALTVSIWDLDSGKKVRELAGFERARLNGREIERALRVMFAGPGEVIATGFDGTVRRWDVAMGKPNPLVLRHEALRSGVRAAGPVAVRPGGKELATTGADSTVRRWDAASGQLLATLEGARLGGTTFVFTAAAYHPASNVLLTGGTHLGALLRAWDARTLREQRAYTEGYPTAADEVALWPAALAFDPSGRRFAAGLVGGDLLFYETRTGRLLHREPKAHSFPNNPIYARLRIKQAVTALAWSHDGKRLVSAGNDNRLRLWDAETYRPLNSWGAIDPEAGLTPEEQRRPHGPTALLFEGDDRHVLSGGVNGFLLRWEAAGGKLVTRVPGRLSAVTTLAASRDGKWLATGGSVTGLHADVVLWDWDRKQAVWAVSLSPLLRDRPVGAAPGGQLAPGAVVSLCFSPDLRLLVVSLADGSVSLLDTATGAVLHRATPFGPQPGNPLGLTLYCFVSEGRELLTAGGDGQVLLWGLPPLPAAVRRPGWKAQQLAAAPDGKEWACVTAAGQLRFWDTAAGDGWPLPSREPVILDLQTTKGWPRYTPPGRPDIPDRPRSLAYTPDGAKLIVGNAYGTAAVLDRRTHAVLAVFGLPAELRLAAITGLSVHPSGQVVASNCAPVRGKKASRVDLWQPQDGKPLKTLAWEGPPVVTVAFRPNGNDLAALDEGGLITVWDWRAGTKRFAVQGAPAATVRTGLAYAPGGEHFIQAGLGGQTVVFDADSGRERQTWHGHQPLPGWGGRRYAQVKSLAVSRDGLLATCGTDATVRLWKRDDQGKYQPAAVVSTLRLASYKASPLRTPPPNQVGPPLLMESGELHHVGFTPDGAYLVTWGLGVPVHLVSVRAVLQDLQAITAAEALRETERLIGLHLDGTGMTPVSRNRLVPPSRSPPEQVR